MFWLITALLVLLSLIFVVMPLMTARKNQSSSRLDVNRALYDGKLTELQLDLEKGLLDQEEYDDAVAELQRTLLDDAANIEPTAVSSNNNYALVIIVVAILPISSVFMYKYFSSIGNVVVPNAQQANIEEQARSLEQAVVSLEAHLQQNPNDADGWKNLGQSYFVMQQFDKAVEAYLKANELKNNADPDVLVLLAEASGFAKDDLFEEYEISLLNQALQINPNHERALWYSGYTAYSADQFQEAVVHWEKLLALVPESRPDVRDTLVKFANSAREKAGLPTPEAVEAVSQTPTDVKRSITVSVTLDEALKNKVADTDTLFIFARAANGPKMPLSLARLSVSDLPANVVLSEDTAMIESMNLTTFDQVHALARISKSGQAITQSGDLIATEVLVNFSDSPQADVSLKIDSIVE